MIFPSTTLELAVFGVTLLAFGLVLWSILGGFNPKVREPVRRGLGKDNKSEREPTLTNAAWLEQAEKELRPRRKRRDTDRLN